MKTKRIRNSLSLVRKTQRNTHKLKTTKQQNSRKTSSKRIFNREDYNSKDGMLTYVWGPPLWHSLHTISFNYPVDPTETQKREYRKWFMGLKHILPCRYCRENLVKNMKALPLTMECMKNRETFSKYVYELHEHVNTMLGKKSGLSYDDVRERYEHFRARCFQGKEIPKHPTTILSTKKTRKEKGCTTPLYGKKSKCVMSIVPLDTKCETFTIDKECERSREK